MTNIQKTFLAPSSTELHYLHELSMAAEFQRAVLSNIVNTDYLDIAVHYQPLEMVSGDIYDFKLNREKELGIFVGDATGHGITAALMTMMVHIAFDNLTPNMATDKSIRKLNQLIAIRDTHRFVTGVFFRVSPNGQVSVTHAGHPSIIIVPKNRNKLVTFNQAGCPLGLFDHEPVTYVEETYQLEKGDKIIAYTDGLIEQSNTSKEYYGEQRLQNLLSLNRTDSSKACLELIKKDLYEFASSTCARDDITLLVATYH
ncbi:MAG: PP2C family protein-serine/threonine phosphatase [Pseudomonadota bacterium]